MADAVTTQQPRVSNFTLQCRNTFTVAHIISWLSRVQAQWHPPLPQVSISLAMDNMDKVQLVYCKSKVYIHPSKSAKDNIPGYLALVRPPKSKEKDILLSWIPESLIKEKQKDYDGYVQVDLDPDSGDVSIARQVFVSAPPAHARSTHAFSIPLTNIYSIQVRKPVLGYWWGSLLIFTRDQTTLPALFFHDSESQSTLDEQKRANQDFDTFSHGDLLWGGSRFLEVLSHFCKTVKSTVEPNVVLVNPDTVDKLGFSPATATVKKASPTWEDAKWGLLEKLASITRFSRKAGQQVLDRTPGPVKAILSVPEVEQLSQDFDSARVYLAEWALGIAQDTNRSKYDVVWTEGVDDTLAGDTGDFSVLKVSRAVERRNPVTLDEWTAMFDYSGRLTITVDEVKERIFHGGLEPNVRPEAWLFLLGFYPWDSDKHERASIVSERRNEYYRLKRRWWDDHDRQSNDEFWRDQKARIEKDVLRTDRNLELFAPSDIPHPDPESRFAANGANPHLEQMKDMLITYNEYNANLGYVQGMSDLLSPLYVVLQDDALAFWAFSEFMRRMERNFLRDQSGMRAQLETLDHLCQLMLPRLYDHLAECDSTHFFFFFRMLLVWFKREFDWDSVMRLWEVLWTDYLSSQFHLFVALAMLDINKHTIMEQLHAFDEILKFINELGQSLDVDTVLVRAEQLFLRFRTTVEVVDRKVQQHSQDKLPEIPLDLRLLLSKQVVEVKEVERPPNVGGG